MNETEAAPPPLLPEALVGVLLLNTAMTFGEGKWKTIPDLPTD